MFIDYQSAVFKAFQEKKADNSIQPSLINPSPAKIRDECMLVCEERYGTKDEPLLRRFFGKRENREAYIEAMQNHETGKFKPLINYLMGDVKLPDEKNVELLAWLINFEPRPYDPRKWNVNNVIVPEKENGATAEEQEEDAPEKKEEETIIEVITDPPVKPKPNLKPAATWILLVISIGSGLYFSLKPRKPIPTGPQSCMYWTGDHYEQISCNEKVNDAQVIALDSAKLNHFKKITEPDTITGMSKGQVWYVKVNAGIEFYTSDGFHPIDSKRKLRPLTDYIIYKYVHPN